MVLVCLLIFESKVLIRKLTGIKVGILTGEVPVKESGEPAFFIGGLPNGRTQRSFLIVLLPQDSSLLP